MMGSDEFEDLKQDIAKNGLHEPIWLHPNDDSIIDGRNRYKACMAAGIEPKFRTWDGRGSLIQFVLSLNLHRRHLTSSQKAMIAVDSLPFLEDEAKQRQGARTDIREKIPEGSKGKSVDKAAGIVGTNGRYVSDAKKIQEQAPDIADMVREGSVNMSNAMQLAKMPEGKRNQVIEQVRTGEANSVKEAIGNLSVASHQLINSSESNEWYTPGQYVEAARTVMGCIDLDPASCEYANRTVKAAEIYTESTNGFNKEWRGRVWLNPPYGFNEIDNSSNQAAWSAKLIEQYCNGNVSQAVLLVNAVPGNKWFAPLWDFPICFTNHRIRFYNEETEAGQPTHSNALVYLGGNVPKFVEAFSRFGPVVARIP